MEVEALVVWAVVVNFLTPFSGLRPGVRFLHRHLPPSWSGLALANNPNDHLKS